SDRSEKIFRARTQANKRQRGSALVPARVLLLPVPDVARHVVDGASGPPAELTLGLRRGAIGRGEVALAARLDRLGQFLTGGLLERGDELENADGVAGAEVVRDEAG